MLMRTKVDSLQGLRFWAATLVVASHCHFLNQGGVGNCIFFALSGFLAVVPFKDDGECDYLSFKKVFSFYARRFFRIIPVYWIGLFITCFLMSIMNATDLETDRSLLLNMFFIKSFCHLWFLQQEMVYYVILPFILIILALIKTLLRKFIHNAGAVHVILAVFLFAAARVSKMVLTREVFYLDGNNQHMPFMLCNFLYGMTFAYIYKALKSFDFAFMKSKAVKVLTTLYTFGFLLITILTAEPILSSIDPRFAGTYIGWDHPMTMCCLTAGLLTLLLFHTDSIGSKFLSIPLFTYLGDISFIIYFIHAFIMSFFAGIQGPIRQFLVVYFVSVCVSVVLHVLVEKPFMLWSKDMKGFSWKDYYVKLLGR